MPHGSPLMGLFRMKLLVANVVNNVLCLVLQVPSTTPASEAKYEHY